MLERLSYANVMATTAVVLSLGGASYAAFSLPPHSVGPRELKSGGVTLGALGFPLMANGMTDRVLHRLSKGDCNSPPRPGLNRHVVSCPPARALGALFNPPIFQVDTAKAGHLVLSILVGTSYEGEQGTRADVQLVLVVDNRLVGLSTVIVAGGESEQVPVQDLIRVPAGLHMIKLQAKVNYSSFEPGEVTLSPISFVALSLP